MKLAVLDNGFLGPLQHTAFRRKSELPYPCSLLSAH